MMTIKHVHETGEYLVEGINVQYHDRQVHYTDPVTREIKSLDQTGGTAYVMNERGATVATYDTYDAKAA
jgi:hypothetical protein